MVFYFYLPVAHLVLGNTVAYIFFCFRKISFTLSPTCPDTNFTSPSRDEWKSSWWKLWEALWPVCVESGVQRGCCHSSRGWQAAAVQKGRSKPENSLTPWPCGFHISECSIIMLFSKPLCFSTVTHTCGFQHFLQERRTHAMGWNNSISFLSPFG